MKYSQQLSKLGLGNTTGSTTFKRLIAPKITAHITKPITVEVQGDNAFLNDWLVENLQSINLLQARTSGAANCKTSINKEKR